MTLEELKKLIADDEGETVEVKETTWQRGGGLTSRLTRINKNFMQHSFSRRAP